MTDKEAQRIASALEIIAVELVKQSGVVERFAVLFLMSGDEREDFLAKERAQREAAQSQPVVSNVVPLNPQPQYLMGHGGIPIKTT